MLNTHLIGKQRWELNIGSTKDSYAIQQKISEFVWKELLPELAKLFDRLTSEDKVIRLDTVELDLGLINLDDMKEKQVVDQIINRLETELFRITSASPQHLNTEDWKMGTGDTLTASQHHFDCWLYWLDNGSLPPYSIKPGGQWILSVLETLGLSYDAVERLYVLLNKSEVALQRLIVQHKKNDLASIVELYTGYSQTDLVDFFKEGSKFYKRHAEKKERHTSRELEIGLWKMVFETVILQREKLNSQSLSTLLVRHPVLWSMGAHFQEKSANQRQYPNLNRAFQEALAEAPRKNKKAPGGPELKQGRDEQAFKEDAKMDDDQELSATFFNNAGVVLLHPFLKHLFQKLKLLKNENFKSFSCQNKAVLLIQYLATGMDQNDEYEMVLPKFLCGMPANLPLDHTLKLSKAEKKEANSLLEAAIDHWGALGDTSPDGMREGFLMRDGKLVKEQSGWKLFVEQKAMDILLDKLPWNLSMIKLPWMKELLNVEWR